MEIWRKWYIQELPHGAPYVILPVMHNGKILERDTLVQLKVENLDPYF